jgi:hypothetical protein
MSNKKKNLRTSTGVVIDSNTIKTVEPMDNLKVDDVVVIIHADDYRESFESMMQRINKMDDKVSEQSKLLNGNIKENKGFLGRFKNTKK